MVENFGKRLKCLRTENGITQTDLANALGVSKGTISFWENDVNEPTIGNLIKMCEFFKVSSDYILGLADY